MKHLIEALFEQDMMFFFLVQMCLTLLQITEKSSGKTTI